MKNKARIGIITLSLLLIFSACHAADAPSDDTAPTTDVTTAQQTSPNETAPQTGSVEAPPEATAPVLDGSFSTPDYEVRVIDGVCYLNFPDGGANDTENTGGEPSFGEITYLTFPSLAEMRRILLHNELSSEHIRIIKNHFPKTDSGIEICNVDALLQPILPDGIQASAVDLLGAQYRFSLDGTATNAQLGGLLQFSAESRWDAKYAETMEVIGKQTSVSHTADTFDGLPCESYTYTTSTSRLKDVILTIPGEDGEADRQVLLCYVLETSSDLAVSDSIPLHVYIYSQSNSTHYSYTLYGLTEAPTVEWLSAFSIAPYVDSGNSPAA